MLRIPRIIAIALLSMGLAAPAIAGVGVRSVPIVLSPDGEADSAFPLGDKPPAVEELTWDNDALNALLLAGITRTVGDPQVVMNVRATLGGDEADTANIVLTQKTGDVTLDWFTEPLLTDNLLFDCDASPGAGAGGFKVRAVGTNGGVTSTSAYSWICNAVPEEDGINHNGGDWWQMNRAGQEVNDCEAGSTDPNDCAGFVYRKNNIYPEVFDNGNDDFVGISNEYHWADLETTQGNCTRGVNLLLAELEYLSGLSPPRRLMAQFNEEERKPGEDVAGAEARFEEVFPTYMGPSGLDAIYAFVSGSPGSPAKVTWDMDVSAAVTARNNLFTCLANGLQARPDLYEYFEGWRLNNETTGAYSTSFVTHTKYETELLAWAQHIRAEFPTKLVWGVLNRTSQTNQNLYKNMIASDVLLGCGDTLPRGASGTGSTGTFCERSLMGIQSGFTDDLRDAPYNTKFLMAIEGSEMGGDAGVYPTNASAAAYTTAELGNYIDDTVQATYRIWQTWDGCCVNIDAIKTWVAANPLTDTTPPAHYP